MVTGAVPGSQEITFRPQAIKGGNYQFAIGTAGSTTLVVQTVLPALWHASAPSTLRLEGGTHNPLAPPADFLTHAFAPMVARMDAPVTIALERHGFYPAGGGVLHATVEPCAQLRQCVFDARGDLVSVEATVLLSALSASIGRRELQVLELLQRLKGDGPLNPAQRADLDAAIVGIEEYYFAADRNGHPPPDLRGIAERFAGAGK